MDIFKNFPDIVVVLGVILIISFVFTGNNQLKIADKKIAEFKNKSFSSPEEKEKAKDQLKAELLKIRSRMFWFSGGSKYFTFKIDGKIMNL